MAEEEQDRSEQATPHKLKDARDKGRVARSVDFSSAFAVLAFLAVLSFMGERLGQRLLQMDAAILSRAADLPTDQLARWCVALAWESLAFLAPVLAACFFAGVLGGFIQVGPVFSFAPLKPDLDRINPVSGFKRLFTWRLLFEGTKSFLKLALFAGVLYLSVKGELGSLIAFMDTPPAAYPGLMLDVVGRLVLKFAMALVFVALLDLVFQRWDFLKRMMMSRREVKDETKRREGDPRVRSRLRELRREMLKRSKSLKRVKDADVLITNPQHLAVAVMYRREKMTSPQVIAKGAGDLAQRMKQMARRHRVPIFENKPLARALFHKVQLENHVPESLFADLARVLVWAYALHPASRERM